MGVSGGWGGVGGSCRGVASRTRGGAHWAYLRASWWRWYPDACEMSRFWESLPQECFDPRSSWAQQDRGQFLKEWGASGFHLSLWKLTHVGCGAATPFFV